MLTEHERAFLSWCEQILPFSHAQRFQDLFALWCNSMKKGYFVEFGALNGIDWSNTYFLENLSWQGIIAEPHPDYSNTLKSNRNCHFSNKAVYMCSNQKVTFKAVKGRPALSGISDLIREDMQNKNGLRDAYIEYEVETISLFDLLKTYSASSPINFLSIDTEGSELKILSAFNFNEYDIRTICVEHNNIERENIRTLLYQYGFKRYFERISGHDDWYTKENLLNTPYLSACANQFVAEAKAKPFLPRFERDLDSRQKLIASWLTER